MCVIWTILWSFLKLYAVDVWLRSYWLNMMASEYRTQNQADKIYLIISCCCVVTDNTNIMILTECQHQKVHPDPLTMQHHIISDLSFIPCQFLAILHLKYADVMVIREYITSWKYKIKIHILVIFQSILDTSKNLIWNLILCKTLRNLNFYFFYFLE